MNIYVEKLTIICFYIYRYKIAQKDCEVFRGASIYCSSQGIWTLLSYTVKCFLGIYVALFLPHPLKDWMFNIHQINYLNVLDTLMQHTTIIVQGITWIKEKIPFTFFKIFPPILIQQQRVGDCNIFYKGVSKSRFQFIT